MIDRVWSDIRIPVKDDKWDAIYVRLYYSLGGMNFWTYKNEPRGYYLSVTPTLKCANSRMIMSSPMDGTKACVLEVPRKSAKREADASAKAADVAPGLIRWVCGKIGVPVVSLDDGVLGC